MTALAGPDLQLGAVVEVRFVKWGDQPHWEMDLRYLGEDEYGLWVGGPKGFHMSRPGMTLDSRTDVAMLVPRGKPFVASFNGPGHGTCDIYVDISTVPVWEGARMQAVDLDLDVVRALDGTVLVDDEDEFAEHQVSYGYPTDVIELAERSCADVMASMSAAAEPWATVGHRWVEVAAGTASVVTGDRTG
jgi:hypothetical protein